MDKKFCNIEEQILNIWDSQESHKSQAIPIILYSKNGKPFEVPVLLDSDDIFFSPFFIIKSIDKIHLQVCLSALEPLGMDGCTIDFPGYVYSLGKTNQCVIVNFSHFCGIQSLPPKLVNRSLPIIHPK
ncbi:MAG TPA: CotY/CotZ family spore coat protein [Neobacillus sp.]